MTRLREEAALAAGRARLQLLWVAPAAAALIVVSRNRRDWLPGLATEVQVASVIGLVCLGWLVARDVARAVAPALLGRLGPETAATVGFFLRLTGLITIILVALRLAGLPPQTLAFGGAAAAVVLGLAAQQTLGNLFAGIVMLSNRPFRIGERVRFQGGNLAGQLEGTVVSLGLLYIEMTDGANRVMVPNAAALACAVTPLKEIDAVDFEAKLRAGTLPSEVQQLLDQHVTVATRGRPHIDLVGVQDDEVVVRITATPADSDDGWLLADQVIAAVNGVTREDITAEHAVVRSGDTREHAVV
ncbi:MAG: mechanosensitive ion channel family protein [Solirubrobacteraceae bacterium]|nr:mechanosensitive ion channel family protein [Solirubrobacteraceae bacterium]